jgi:hypothetical protein
MMRARLSHRQRCCPPDGTCHAHHSRRQGADLAHLGPTLRVVVPTVGDERDVIVRTAWRRGGRQPQTAPLEAHDAWQLLRHALRVSVRDTQPANSNTTKRPPLAPPYHGASRNHKKTCEKSRPPACALLAAASQISSLHRDTCLDGVHFFPRLLQRQHLPQDHPKTIQIRRLIELLAAQHLRRHPARRACAVVLPHRPRTCHSIIRRRKHHTSYYRSAGPVPRTPSRTRTPTQHACAHTQAASLILALFTHAAYPSSPAHKRRVLAQRSTDRGGDVRLVHAEAGQAEVAHLDAVIVVDEEVVRLDVAMHDRRLPVVQVEDACSRLPFPLSPIPHRLRAQPSKRLQATTAAQQRPLRVPFQ